MDMRFRDSHMRAKEARNRMLAGEPCSSFYMKNILLHREETDPGQAKPVGSFGTECGIQIMKDIDKFRWEWLREKLGDNRMLMFQF